MVRRKLMLITLCLGPVYMEAEDPKQVRLCAYRVAQNFCGSSFLQIGNICVLREQIFVIRTDWE